jgi:hypothetical protein
MRKVLSTVGAAVVLATAALGGPAPAAHAETNTGQSPAQTCKADGGVWVEGQGCAKKKCTSLNGPVFQHPHGTVRDGSTCNGFTGKWEKDVIPFQPAVIGHILAQDTPLVVLHEGSSTGPTRGVASPLSGGVFAQP